MAPIHAVRTTRSNTESPPEICVRGTLIVRREEEKG